MWVPDSHLVGAVEQGNLWPGDTSADDLGRTLVVAPHPDDETIGCGGLLALLAQAGRAVHVVLVSDGAASHPCSRSHGPARLRALRLQEMRAALHELGCGGSPLTALALPDGAVPAPGGEGYQAALERLVAVADGFRPDTVVLPWRCDAHPDHRASHALGMAMCQRVVPGAALLEYRVWSPLAEGATMPSEIAPARIWHIDITSVLGRKRSALAQHRSQLGQAVFDDPEGFSLPPALLDACEQAFETFFHFQPGNDHEHNPPPPSLQPAYFDRIYAEKADPWGFESSSYEQAKYAATLNALQGRVFDRGFEIGCSIGVLTALLAAHCRRLLSVDVSETALAQARVRLASQPQVDVRSMNVPHEFPEQVFDLVVMSEVGYYWNLDDLSRASNRIVNALVPDGVLLLVHWTPVVTDHPLTGDAVHGHFLALCTPTGPLRHLNGHREATFRIDALGRTARLARWAATSARV